MADSRIKDLTGAVLSTELSALLNTLYLVVDDASFTQAKKILLKTILTEAIIDANTNNYQAMTPKAFYDSIMTTTRRGIGMLALDADVTSKTGTGLLNSVHQVLMQAQWRKDWFQANGVPALYMQDQAVPTAISYDSNLFQSMAPSSYAAIGASLPLSKKYDALYVHVVTRMGLSTSNGGTYLIDANGTNQVHYIGGSSNIALVLTADDRNLYIQNTSVSAYDVSASAHVNAVLKDA